MTNVKIDKPLTEAQMVDRIKVLENQLGWTVVSVIVAVCAVLVLGALVYAKSLSVEFWKESTYSARESFTKELNRPKACEAYMPSPVPRIKELEQIISTQSYEKLELKHEARLWEVVADQCESKFNAIKGMVK